MPRLSSSPFLFTKLGLDRSTLPIDIVPQSQCRAFLRFTLQHSLHNGPSLRPASKLYSIAHIAMSMFPNFYAIPLQARAAFAFSARSPAGFCGCG